jgi:hypothetical protein
MGGVSSYRKGSGSGFFRIGFFREIRFVLDFLFDLPAYRDFWVVWIVYSPFNWVLGFYDMREPFPKNIRAASIG